jgi:hypothetical protein
MQSDFDGGVVTGGRDQPLLKNFKFCEIAI